MMALPKEMLNLEYLTRRIDELRAFRKRIENPAFRDIYDIMTFEERELRGIRRIALGLPVLPEFRVGRVREVEEQ